MPSDKVCPIPMDKILSFRRNPAPEQQLNQQTDQMEAIPNFLPAQLTSNDLQGAPGRAKDGPKEVIPTRGRRLTAGESLQSDMDGLPPPRRSPVSRRNVDDEPSTSSQYMNVIKAALAVVTVCVMLTTIPLYRRQQAKKDANQKRILLWNDDSLVRGAATHMECGCIVTNRREPSDKQIDAVVFNADYPYSMEGFPQLNHTSDYLVVFSALKPLNKVENPLRNGLNPPFNLTMTYRRDSHLVWSDYYFSHSHMAKRLRGFRPRKNFSVDDFSLETARRLEAALNAKKELAVYLMYEVNDDSLPESLYLEEMRKYAELEAQSICVGSNDCSGYFFWLVFETSACPDYVPTQMYMAMEKLIVPVVIGSGNLTNLVPEGSYIRASDFDSPKELVGYLKDLSTKPHEYIAYFWWHSLYKVRAIAQPYCALCHFLQTPPKERQLKKEGADLGFIHWWSEYQCPVKYTTFL
ncbi:hypothetical protein KR026_006327 [Drosophila bipectinata]|nr:hypothetical protein KR026_006327 [Drosophila bipectinata]